MRIFPTVYPWIETRVLRPVDTRVGRVDAHHRINFAGIVVLQGGDQIADVDSGEGLQKPLFAERQAAIVGAMITAVHAGQSTKGAQLRAPVAGVA